jgi:hypothetical protein
VITFYSKSPQHIGKYMRFQNFLAALSTTVYHPISLPQGKNKGKLFMNAA